MNFRVDPATLSRLSTDLNGAASRLGNVRPPAEADAGPSSSAVSATVAEFMRNAAGFAESTSKTAGDLDANKAAYASTEDDNVGMLGQARPH